MYVCDVATYISGPDAEFLTNQQNMRMQAVGNIIDGLPVCRGEYLHPAAACVYGNVVATQRRGVTH